MKKKHKNNFPQNNSKMKNNTKKIFSNTRTSEEKAQIQFPIIQEQMKKMHKYNFQQNKHK